MTIPYSLPPIIERELRVAARLGATYWSRVVAAGSGIIVFLWVMSAQLAVAPAASAGQITFRFLAAVAALSSVASVLRLSAEAFAREKREDTLGLLFLTPLRPIDLVLGKLVSTSLAAFYRFVAIIPLLALPMLIGGVTVGNFVLLVLALGNLVFFGATLGLYVSARAWNEKRAATITTVTMLGLTALLPALAVGFAAAQRLPGAMSLFALSPAFPLWQATGAGAANSWGFWVSLLLTHVAGWVLIRATCRALPLCWQDRPVSHTPLTAKLRRPREEAWAQQLDLAETAPLPHVPSSATATDKARRSVRRQFDEQHRSHLLDHNPMLWLALRWRADSTGAWVMGSIGLVVMAVLALTGPPEVWFSPGMALLVIFCVNAALKIHVATQGSLAFARDRGENTLDMLLSTPITPHELIQGHLLALREPLRVWIRRVLWIEGIWLAFSITAYGFENRQGELWLYVPTALALLGFLIPDVYAVSWAALWLGVVERNARAAESQAFMQVLVLPWLLAFLATFIPRLVFGLGSGMGTLFFFLVFYVLSSALADWWFTRRARRKLYAELGLWALRRSSGEFENYDGWRRAGRWLGRWLRKRSRRR